MAEVLPPAFMQAGTASHPAKLWRRMLKGLLNEGVTDFNVAGDLKVVQNSPTGMSVRVERGGAYVQGDDSTDQGLYFVYNDAYEVLTVTAAHATLARKDIVVARIRDATEGGPAGDDWVLEVIAGTPAASPSEPATPNSCYRLATISIAAAATQITSANITDRRVQASGTGVGHTPTIHTFVGTRVYRTTVQSIPNSTNTAADFPTGSAAETYDTDNIHNLSANATRLLVPTGMGGYWAIFGKVAFAAHATGDRLGFVRLNGTTTLFSTTGRATTTAQPFHNPFYEVRNLSAGAYIELLLWQNSGAALNTVAGEDGLVFGMHYLGV